MKIILSLLFALFLVSPLLALHNDTPVTPVWPKMFVAQLTNTGIAPKTDFLSYVGRSTLYYDFPGARQRYNGYALDDVNHETLLSSEIWLTKESMIYDIDWVAKKCDGFKFQLGPLRPNWPEGSTFKSTTYIASLTNTSGLTKADLWTKPAPLGITKAYFVHGSDIGMPVQLGGPASFSNPNYYSIMSFSSFKPVTSFESDVWQVPAFCNSSSIVNVHKDIRNKRPTLPLMWYAGDDVLSASW